MKKLQCFFCSIYSCTNCLFKIVLIYTIALGSFIDTVTSKEVFNSLSKTTVYSLKRIAIVFRLSHVASLVTR